MRKKYIILPFIFCLIFLSQFLSCNLVYVPEEAMIDWISTFHTRRTFGGFQETFDHGYVIMGGTWDEEILLIKTNQYGKEIWHRVIGDDNYILGNHIQQTKDNGFIIVGAINYYDPPEINDYDIYLIKTDPNGKKNWIKTFGEIDHIEWGKWVQQTFDGGYIILGIEDVNNVYSSNIYLLKTDELGNKLWDRTFEPPSAGYIIRQTSDGGYIILGYSESPSIGEGIYIIKTDSEGNQIWYRTINNNFFNINWCNPDIKQTTDGGFIVLGTLNMVESPDYDSIDFYLIKLDSEGNTTWNKTYGAGKKNEYGCCILQTSDSHFILAGIEQKRDSYNTSTLIIKTDLNGIKIWERRIYANDYFEYGKCSIEPHSIIEPSSGGYVVGGFIENMAGDVEELFLIKIGE